MKTTESDIAVRSKHIQKKIAEA